MLVGQEKPGGRGSSTCGTVLPERVGAPIALTGFVVHPRAIVVAATNPDEFPANTPTGTHRASEA